MKIRFDFVTNSSSSSFVVAKAALTDKQKEMILNYRDYAPEIMPEEYFHDDEIWDIDEAEYLIRGHTFMDNFDMYKYLKLIGVPEGSVGFDYD